MEGSATASAAQATLGTTAQPEPVPMVTVHAEFDAVLEGGASGWPSKRPLTRTMATQSGACLEAT
jgi:hypothetical protein